MSFNTLPLRNIKTKTIVKALVKFFIFVGLPRSVQSDQGSSFMSGIFQQVMHELGIKQYKSSAYHPESQGALERFHQTLKIMTRSYCFDMEKDTKAILLLWIFYVFVLSCVSYVFVGCLKRPHKKTKNWFSRQIIA